MDLYSNRHWHKLNDKESMYEYLLKKVRREFVILPLYLYDHSVLCISTKPFSCGWDSGQVGWIYVSKKTVVDSEWTKEWLAGRSKYKAAEDILIGEVEIINQYLQGDVYGCIIEEHTKCECCGAVNIEQLDSCWGFYGTNWKENGLIDMVPDELINSLKDVVIEY